MLLQSCNSVTWGFLPGVRENVEVGSEKMLFEQLPPLATDVARVDMVRDYAGEYLRLPLVLFSMLGLKIWAVNYIANFPLSIFLFWWLCLFRHNV